MCHKSHIQPFQLRFVLKVSGKVRPARELYCLWVSLSGYRSCSPSRQMTPGAGRVRNTCASYLPDFCMGSRLCSISIDIREVIAVPFQPFFLAPGLFQEWQSRTIVRKAYTFCYPLEVLRSGLHPVIY